MIRAAHAVTHPCTLTALPPAQCFSAFVTQWDAAQSPHFTLYTLPRQPCPHRHMLLQIQLSLPGLPPAAPQLFLSSTGVLPALWPPIPPCMPPPSTKHMSHDSSASCSLQWMHPPSLTCPTNQLWVSMVVACAAGGVYRGSMQQQQGHTKQFTTIRIIKQCQMVVIVMAAEPSEASNSADASNSGLWLQ